MTPSRARPPRRRRGAILKWLLPGVAAAVALVSFAVALTQAVGSTQPPSPAPVDARAVALSAAPQLAALPAAGLSVPRLKTAYLECDRWARTSVLDSGTAGLCSAIAEELLRRGFDGDFEALLAWWRSETGGTG